MFESPDEIFVCELLLKKSIMDCVQTYGITVLLAEIEFHCSENNSTECTRRWKDSSIMHYRVGRIPRNPVQYMIRSAFPRVANNI